MLHPQNKNSIVFKSTALESICLDWIFGLLYLSSIFLANNMFFIFQLCD